MQQARPLQLPDGAQRLHEIGQVVAVDRPEVIEAELLEQHPRRRDALDFALRAVRQVPHRRELAQHLLAVAAQPGVGAAGENPGEVLRERADVGRDRHLVVVQHHEQIDRHRPRMVERFVGEPGRHAAVADHRRHLARLPLQARGKRHAERGADRGARVAGAEGVELALAAREKAAQPAATADARHALAPLRQDLVRITLVPDIPDHAVMRGVENVMQGHRQLDGAEPGREVAAVARHRLDQIVAQLGRDAGQRRLRKPAQAGWGAYRLQTRIAAHASDPPCLGRSSSIP